MYICGAGGGLFVYKDSLDGENSVNSKQYMKVGRESLVSKVAN